MKERPQVSVVIPLYNQPQFFEEAVRSVLAQTYREYEIIVVDDGSTDESSWMAQQFGDAIRYIRQENQGLAGARNTGIRAAKGAYVALLDSDDTWLPNYLFEIMALISRRPKAAIYHCRAQCIDENGGILPQVVGGSNTTANTIEQTLLRANFLIPSTVTFHRLTVIDAGLFDVAYRRLQDWELWIRLLELGCDFAGLDDVLVRYRIHGSSLSTDPVGGQRAALALAIKHYGPDEGEPATWSAKKRRLYGGVYRYHVLSSIQLQNDWTAGANYLRLALQADPELSEDLDFYYEIGLGAQPPGYRGSGHQLRLEDNADQLDQMIDSVSDSLTSSNSRAVVRRVKGTANYALGLLAYNQGKMSLCRRWLLAALRYRPELYRDNLIIGLIAKSLLGNQLLNRARTYSKHANMDKATKFE